MTKLFPDKDAALLLVGDADGKDIGLAIQALEALEEEGYENLVGLQGGYAGMHVSGFWGFRRWRKRVTRTCQSTEGG